jgi:hypothetical protein
MAASFAQSAPPLPEPLHVARRVAERGPVAPDAFEAEVASHYQPVILRDQVAHWPAVVAGKQGIAATADYLLRFAGGKPYEVLIGKPEIGGRFFYNADMSGFNFHRQQVPLGSFVAELVRLASSPGEPPHALYANAATAPEHAPGWADANRLDLPVDATPRLWIGNAVQVATHYDVSPNIACVVAGRRRFTLFPPEQLPNLYVGPLDRTLAGPPVSLPDPDAPDFDRFPRFSQALDHALVADLGPGDALFIPTIWWHHVRAFDPLNVLVNYWWFHDQGASPFVAMVHAMMAIRDLSPGERAAWRGWFDHFAFGDDAVHAGDHLPPAVRTVLGPPSAERTERMRAYLIGSLQQQQRARR